MYQFKHPFTLMVIGASKTGKTSAIEGIFNKNLIYNKPNKIIWYFKITHPNIKNIEFIKNLPSNIGDIPNDSILIIDDLINELLKNGALLALFTRASHHKNISIILVSQIAFSNTNNNLLRQINLNCEYFLITKFIRDPHTIERLIRQIEPNKANEIIKFYNDICKSQQFAHFLIDCSINCKPEYRFRTHIFSQSIMVKYLPLTATSSVLGEHSTCAYI